MSSIFAGQRICSLSAFIVISTAALISTGCGGSTPQPAPTVVNNESYELSSGAAFSASLTEGVLANDSGDELVMTLLSAPAHAAAGGFNLVEDGSFSYQADVDEITEDSFSYTVTGADGVTLTGIATLSIYPAPETAAEEYVVLPGETLTIDVSDGVLSNDTLYKQPYTLEVTEEPVQSQSFVLNQDGSFEYASNAAGSGVDTFTYRLADELGAAVDQEVRVVLYDEPLAGVDDSFSIQSGSLFERSGQAGIFANDSGALYASAELVKLPEKAIDFALSEDGNLIYRSIETSGTDSFSYLIKSGSQQQGPFTVTLNIQAPAGDPAVWDACTTFDASLTQSVSGQLLASGVTGASFELVTQPRLGMLSSFDASGSFIYQRTADVRGQDSFSYKVYDANGAYMGDGTQELIGTPFRIMPVGDSITAGVEFYNGTSDTPGNDEREGYRKYLKDQLESDGYPIDLVGYRSDGQAVAGFTDTEHSGTPGAELDDVYPILGGWIRDTNADGVLLHIGTNNVHYDDNIPEVVRQANLALDGVKNQASERGAQVATLFAKLIPRTDDPARALRIEDLNSQYQNLVSTRQAAGDRIFLVDQNTAFGGAGDPNGYLSADNLHPMLDGYEVMATEWATRLIETGVLKKCP